MAEAKYDLLLVNTQTEKKIRPQAWYKERIRTKYIKSMKPGDTSKMLVGRNWTFIKDGLDDFRDGLPPDISGGIMIKGTKGPSLNILGSSDSVSPVKQPVQKGRFDKYDICYSRITPQMLINRENIEEIEYGLTQHPLALYPHLEEGMPPDLFEEVVDILDPEMLQGDDEVVSEVASSQSDSRPPTRVKRTASKQRRLQPDVDDDEYEDPFTTKNPYRWLPRKEETDKKDKKKASEKRQGSPSQDQHIKNVTKSFCKWVADLGGESNNIEESTIHSLFASGYETKPALSVPIHVVELTNVPPELRKTAIVGGTAQPTQTQPPLKRLPSLKEKAKDWIHSTNYVPSWAKTSYGAWYLAPKTWKPRPSDEPLRDPKEIKDQEEQESNSKSNELDEQLAPMHCAKSFMDYVDTKNQRRPEFLDRVSELQKIAEQEELDKLEAEYSRKKVIILTSSRQKSSSR